MKSNEIKVEKDVPMPSPGAKYPLDKMEIGDSFFTDHKQRTGIYICAIQQQIKITIRKEGNGLRVWRIA